MDTIINQENKIQLLNEKLNNILNAYYLLEEYTFLLCNEETDTIKFCNEIVKKNIN